MKPVHSLTNSILKFTLELRPLKKMFFLLLTLSACSTPYVTVKQIENANGTEQGNLFYSLPQTVVRVKVYAVKTTYKRGPFYMHAQDMLGITEAVLQDAEKWAIQGAEMDNYAAPDPKYTYMVETSDKTFPFFMSLTSNGLLSTVNTTASSFSSADTYSFSDVDRAATPSISYADLSIHSYQGLLQDTLYRTVMQDSMFVRVPYLRTQVSAKTTQEQAQEAADLIFKLRKRRFKQLTGNYDELFDGKGLEVMVKELDELEFEYVSLFAGKIFKETYEYTFEFVPDPVNILSHNVLCYFSDDYGIQSDANGNGVPIVMDVIKMALSLPIERFEARHVYDPDLQGVFYKIPDWAIVRIVANGRILAEQKTPMPQLGSTSILPNYLLDGTYGIEFYPETGSIKSIKKIQVDK